MNITSIFSIHQQYIKDLSFENPGALLSSPTKNVGINVNIEAKKLAQDTFEVCLHIVAQSNQEDDSTVFLVDLMYAGIFTLFGIH